MRPNLFQFATSELSQDAFLCWLLSWADVKHKKDDLILHKLGKALLNVIYQKSMIKPPEDFSKVEIKKQDGNIDILCIVNDDTAIVIEDKVGSEQHSNQLARYKEYVLTQGKFAEDKTIFVYVQTGDQSNYSEILRHGYMVLRRQDFLNILESDDGKKAREKSDILDDFSIQLRQVEDDIQSYRTLPVTAWPSKSNPWKGFYMSLQENLGTGNWSYIANPEGGFFGFWCHEKRKDECELYFQIEENKFCFKVMVADVKKRAQLRDHWHSQIVSKCSDYGINAKRPNRFGIGQCMTVAVLDQDFPVRDNNGILDMAGTLEIIHSVQSLLDNY